MKLSIPPYPFQAYLFDCDGTLADTMPLHFKAWTTALSKWSCPFDEKLFYEWGGVPVVRIIERLNEQHGLAMPVAEVMRVREEAYFEYLPWIRAVPGVLEHVIDGQGRIPMAVVSGSPTFSVRKTLEALKISHCFDALVCAEDYEHGKPDPQPFLTASRRLGVAPSECLVFEDTPAGVASAKAAGMHWVRV